MIGVFWANCIEMMVPQSDALTARVNGGFMESIIERMVPPKKALTDSIYLGIITILCIARMVPHHSFAMAAKPGSGKGKFIATEAPLKYFLTEISHGGKKR